MCTVGNTDAAGAMQAAATAIRTVAYRRREPEKEPLYQVLAEHLETFLEQTRTSDHQLPRHVEDELRAYLQCGILSYGLVRVRCDDCGLSRAVPFSCTKRGFCPSCLGRRMVDTAARPVEHVAKPPPIAPPRPPPQTELEFSAG